MLGSFLAHEPSNSVKVVDVLSWSFCTCSRASSERLSAPPCSGPSGWSLLSRSRRLVEACLRRQQPSFWPSVLGTARTLTRLAVLSPPGPQPFGSPEPALTCANAEFYSCVG